VVAPKISSVVLDDTEARIRESVSKMRRKKPAKKKEWVRPTLDSCAEGYLLAFDQTCAKTGWVHMRVRRQTSRTWLTVYEMGIIRQPKVPDRVGFEDTLVRAEWMAEEILDRVEQIAKAPMHEGLEIVHEMPAVHGYRPESSLMAALGVRQAATEYELKVTMVNNQHMRSVIGGPGCVDKADTRKALEAMLYQMPDPVIPTKMRWNEDNRDALGLGLAHLIDVERSRA
jgi:hypothetical protein